MKVGDECYSRRWLYVVDFFNYWTNQSSAANYRQTTGPGEVADGWTDTLFVKWSDVFCHCRMQSIDAFVG